MQPGAVSGIQFGGSFPCDPTVEKDRRLYPETNSPAAPVPALPLYNHGWTCGDSFFTQDCRPHCSKKRVERSGSASSDCVSYSCLPSLPRFLAEMGNCNSSNVNAESAEVQVADAQRHPSLLTLKMRTNVKFGWKPDMPDHRDHHVTFDTVSAPSQIKRKAEGAPACL